MDGEHVGGVGGLRGPGEFGLAFLQRLGESGDLAGENDGEWRLVGGRGGVLSADLLRPGGKLCAD